MEDFVKIFKHGRGRVPGSSTALASSVILHFLDKPSGIAERF